MASEGRSPIGEHERGPGAGEASRGPSPFLPVNQRTLQRKLVPPAGVCRLPGRRCPGGRPGRAPGGHAPKPGAGVSAGRELSRSETGCSVPGLSPLFVCGATSRCRGSRGSGPSQELGGDSVSRKFGHRWPPESSQGNRVGKRASGGCFRRSGGGARPEFQGPPGWETVPGGRHDSGQVGRRSQ